MKFYQKPLLYLLWGMGCIPTSGCNTKKIHKKPNVILVLVDDLGWKDTGCYGSTFNETPAIDRLATEGMRFTNAYSAHPVCGPSRAAILTGKAPLRIGNTKINGNVSASEITIAEALKQQGYVTFFAGKWHVGMTEGRDPLQQGFDYAVGLNHSGQPGSYFYPYKDTGCDWSGSKRKLMPNRDVKGLENGEKGEYLTRRLTEEAIHFIEKSKDRSFFLYLSHYAVHTPLEAEKDDIDYFRNKNKKLGQQNDADLEKVKGRAYWRKNSSNPFFAAMIKSVDESLASIQDKLEELKLSENTIIIFTSDNGGLATLNRPEPNIPTSNLPLKYGKGWNYEGGVRVPAIIKWPSIVKPSTISNTPICLFDLYPTILEITDTPLLHKQHIDGHSLVPILKGEQAEKRSLFWYYPQRHGSGHWPSAAIRDGNYKLIWHMETDQIELFDIVNDVSEINNILSKFPHKAELLKKQLQKWIENTSPKGNIPSR